jgi:hypothetical protein
MIEGMANDLSSPWEDLQVNLEHQAEATVDLIDDLFGWAVDFLGKPMTSGSCVN